MRLSIGCLLLIILPSVSLAQDTWKQAGKLNMEELRQVQAGEVVSRKLPEERPGLTFEVIGEMTGSLATMTQVLTDYEAYPEFMSTVEQVKILEAYPDSSILEFRLSLPMGMERKYRINNVLSQPMPDRWMLAWDLIPWPELEPSETLVDTEGFWLFNDLGNGRLLVVYRVYSDPGPIPYGLKWLVTPLSQSSVVQAFVDTRTRVETLSSRP